jgi:hypothetical protein
MLNQNGKSSVVEDQVVQMDDAMKEATRETRREDVSET